MKKFWMGAALAMVAQGLLAAVPDAGGEWALGAWPCLKTYDGAHLREISLGLGGIGTGTVGLGGRGELRDWEIMNVPARGHFGVREPCDAAFFALRASDGSAALLAGPLDDREYLQANGKPTANYGLPRFKRATFASTYPYGRVNLSGGLPLEVEVRAFNPFIPGDSAASSLPVATLTYVVRNRSTQDLEVTVAGALRNFIGVDGSKSDTDWTGDRAPVGITTNVNTFVSEGTLKGVFLSSQGCPRDDAAWGTLALVTDTSAPVSYRTHGKVGAWYATIEDFWLDLTDNGVLSDGATSLVEGWGDGSRADELMPLAALAVKKSIPAGGTATFTFHFVWNFPNRKSWYGQETVGNHYAALDADAWAAAKRIVPQLPDLERRSRAFAEAFVSSTAPDVLKEAALFNLSTLRSQTVFRIPSGHLMGWEGCMDALGSCAGSCTHVWNYEQATAFLFGDLARTMRDVEFNYATRTNGLMLFRADLPLEKATGDGASTHPAADGQMGTILKVYREWLNCGDQAWLEAIWPRVKLVLSFAWTRDGKWNWDVDRDGLMEGLQHNTMDVNYAGPNPQMEFWYLGALKAAARMARAVGDNAFAADCERLFTSGSKLTDEQLFNGEYYEHKINVTPVPDFQLGQGCLVDQLVGQTFARIVGLGDLADPEKTKKAIESVWRFNEVRDFSRFFNPQRAYALGDEGGLLMASFPRGRPENPFPYYAEVMTGFEYAAATEMIYRGLTNEALTVVRQVRARHEGARRNPFSEPECGHHYARAMASWGCLLAWTGFYYSAPDGVMSFGSRPGIAFWSNGSAWGTFTLTKDMAELKVIEGRLALKELRITDRALPLARDVVLSAGESRIVPTAD